DLSDHPELKKLKEENGKDFVFEKASDFPHEGNYYIGYKPVMIDGKLRAVIGVTYRWDDFQSSLTGTIHKALLIIICGIGIVMAVLLVFLYRKTIKPVSMIHKAVLDYTGDKDSARIVAKMYRITVKNELGYLSDAISDLALEIDHYTKENMRIAGEQERTQKELYEAKVQIMVSQIRPHFMYNALTSIAMMCELDPKTAKEATITFAKYLRSNMDSLKQTRPVPFEKELDHLKKYLYIEKLRFDDLLNIEYDIQATNFELPMLSIQPLVENAVKHGVGMKDDGGTVRISTRETDDAFEVIIEDDGVGFDVNAPKMDDGRSHVGMENTKRRLKEMCDADIIITSKVGEGTTARVIIPKKEGKANEDTVS
ncbi:MAG: histidine kinase, partial [Ruminococcus sp.]|nr:histidine kinase [Ruminococcus sp.]